MRFLRFLFLFLGFCGVVLATPAIAQENVKARSGSHDGYSRLVLEWKDKPSYSLSKEEGRLLFRFSKSGTLSTEEFSADKNILGLTSLSQNSEPLQVGVDIQPGSRFRDFVVVNKLIIDVYDSSSAETTKSAQPEAQEAKPETVQSAPEETKAQEPVEEGPAQTEATHDDHKGDFTRKPAESAKPAPVEDVESTSVAAPAFDAHVITLTSITSIGMAVYERNGMLYIVTDSSDANIAPQLTGPQKDRFPPIQKIPNGPPEGSLYSMEMPEGLSAHAEGGGLAWRILLTPDKKTAAYAEPKIEAGAGKIIWPLKNMRKALSYTDPLVGDKMTIVTSTDARQLAGPARAFVNLKTFNSIVGLAFAAKTDHLKTALGLSEVSVESPAGLSLSSSVDVQPEKIRKTVEGNKQKEETSPSDDHNLELTEAPPEAEHEEEAAETATKEEMHEAVAAKPSGNNIFNLPNWEMGGVQALAGNIHVLMVEAAAKTSDNSAEDIITMAKLLIANHRGQEALGMLRIALQKVPAIDENAEFQALRGAALALSGKYDEAFVDFTREQLQKFDDIKLWLAFTLGGLEDWKQAGDVMPADISQIQSYPVSIRTPFAIMFAEIALRNGRIDEAEKILGLLQNDLPKLPLAWASAWNYLAGEAARQRGEVDRATEYWEPLVKNGKDDLYRAKAGLSLTKLQIDEKKLKPNEAIDRLEGLRYAWRGDELETLINYRLGKMYIDNKDYLKGLTVLRNATTLTPGLQVGEDVRRYMTNSFRDIFVNDRIKNVSPLDAIGIYEEFKDLTPPGPEGDVFVDKLAERLVDADLLGRAASLLDYQVNNRLKGDKKVEVAIRLAAIRLLDGNPDGAIRSLEIAQDTLNKMDGADVAKAETMRPENVAPQAGDDSKAAAEAAPEKADPEKQRQIYLLKARALSMKKKPEEAIAILDQMAPDPDVNRLRTDIAWFAGKWEEAAMSLNDLILSEDISPRRPLTEYQRDLILNRAISLNLSGNRVALANLRERYNAQMKDTAKGQMFEVVTRPRRPDMIGSREAIESMISEIDLFQGFLEGYGKMMNKKQDKKASAPTTTAPEGISDVKASEKKEEKAAH